ncbi:hypothetical protein BDZ45DRAFT_751720 [Acephala macrosclerotiorum]|nr:hypothetical protein BDZ45DRAFT_751720 [Acephala macrosclerotiorum]
MTTNTTLLITSTRKAWDPAWTQVATPKGLGIPLPVPESITSSNYTSSSISHSPVVATQTPRKRFNTFGSATQNPLNSELISKSLGCVTIMTPRDVKGVPYTTITEVMETLLDSNGLPAQTIFQTLQTLADLSGRPTRTLTKYLPTDTSSASTSATNPSQTTPYNNTNIAHYIPLSWGNYFIIFFLPILVAVLLSIFI